MLVQFKRVGFQHKMYQIPSFIFCNVAVFLFVLSAVPYSSYAQQEIFPSDIESGDLFGVSVSVSGSRAVVGAHKKNTLGTSSGAAYVLVKQGGFWVEEAKLLASNGVAGDWFGFSVAIEDDRIVVGAPQHDSPSGADGVVYVFERQGTNWVETAIIYGANTFSGGQFGYSVDIDSGRIIVGSPGEPQFSS